MMYKDAVEAIEAVVTRYFKGIYEGDISKLQAVFEERVLIYGDMNNGIPYCKSVQEYLEGVKARQSPSELGEAFLMKIIGIEIIGNTAIVKAHVPMLGYNYYDFLSLTIIDGDWKIVNKLFAHVA
ncbi:MAG: nuclear transport factor 2 family protein [Aureispira sp.]